MIKFYTPKEWRSFFECPSLIIDKEGKIWAADAYYKIVFGEPSGRIDYSAGKIYGKDLGYGMFSEPIAYLETQNGVTRVLDAKKGLFSSPILYIQNDKVYTPEQWTSVIDAPSGYIKHDGPPPEGPVIFDPPPAGGGKSDGSSGGGSMLTAVLSVVLVLALPAILFNLTNIFIVLAVIYLVAAVVAVVRYGAVFNGRNLVIGIVYGFLTLAAVYLILFVITTLWSGYNRAVMNELEGRNELAGWIAGAGTLLLQFVKTK